ncbi:PREDICTED: uncharacterized protein LOC109130449 [Camelina sativa]|uniref:Uncharacterized protein LOC109130449 n=1 Tax=Camelina sativa TaxID=90675 RepID=A0ABM1R970_CAMSA|nr:PREDICTED: uncharacterized protein LOC109130449 [Camelina sativa]
MTTHAKKGIIKPNSKYVIAISKLDVEPQTVLQALADDKWRASISDKFNAQLHYRTWSLVAPALGQNLMDTKWLFWLKYSPDGPVIKATTIRIVLQTAGHYGWSIKQLDVNNAFLQGSLTKEVYVCKPEGFVDAN